MCTREATKWFGIFAADGRRYNNCIQLYFLYISSRRGENSFAMKKSENLNASSTNRGLSCTCTYYASSKCQDFITFAQVRGKEKRELGVSVALWLARNASGKMWVHSVNVVYVCVSLCVSKWIHFRMHENIKIKAKKCPGRCSST